MRKVRASYATAKAKIISGIGLGILGFAIREWVSPALTVTQEVTNEVVTSTTGADVVVTTFTTTETSTITKSMLNNTMVSGLSLITIAAGLVVLFAGVKEILDVVSDL